MRGKTSATRGLSVANFCIAMAVMSPLASEAAGIIHSGTYVYGVCLREAAEAGLAALTRELPEEGPYRADARHSEYDRLSARDWDNSYLLRSFVPQGGKREQINWASKHRTLSVMTFESENGCEVVDVEISPYYN